MPDYYEFLMRHGEFVVQDLVESMERVAGIVANSNLPLEQRWEALMFQPVLPELQFTAA